MNFNSWELLALEKCLEDGIKSGRIEALSGKTLLLRIQQTKLRNRIRTFKDGQQ